MHIEQITITTDIQQLEACEVVWVNSKHIGFYQVAAPTIPKRRWSEVLPWTIDEQCLLDPDMQHVVAIELPFDKAVDESQQVALIAVPNQTMEVWRDQIDTLNNDAIVGKPWCPDVLALPHHERGWSIWQNDDKNCLVRTDKYSGFITQPSALKSLLVLLDNSGKSATSDASLHQSMPESINIYTHNSSVGEALDNDLDNSENNTADSLEPLMDSDVTEDDFNVDLQQIAVNHFQVNDGQWPFNETDAVVNVLQGAYKPKFNFRKKIIESPKLTSYLSMAACLLLWLYLGLSIANVNQQSNAIEQQINRQLEKFFATRYDPRIGRDRWINRLERNLEEAGQIKQQNLWSILKILDPLVSQCAGRCQVANVTVKMPQVALSFSGEESALGALRKRLVKLNIEGLSIQLSAQKTAATLAISLKRLES